MPSRMVLVSNGLDAAVIGMLLRTSKNAGVISGRLARANRTSAKCKSSQILDCNLDDILE